MPELPARIELINPYYLPPAVGWSRMAGVDMERRLRADVQQDPDQQLVRASWDTIMWLCGWVPSAPLTGEMTEPTHEAIDAELAAAARVMHLWGECGRKDLDVQRARGVATMITTARDEWESTRTSALPEWMTTQWRPGLTVDPAQPAPAPR